MEKLKQDLSLNHLPGDTLFVSAPHSCDDLQCPGDINRRKLEAAEEMARAIAGAETHYSAICEVLCADNPPPGGYPILVQLRTALTSWKKAGKGECG